MTKDSCNVADRGVVKTRPTESPNVLANVLQMLFANVVISGPRRVSCTLSICLQRFNRQGQKTFLKKTFLADP